MVRLRLMDLPRGDKIGVHVCERYSDAIAHDKLGGENDVNDGNIFFFSFFVLFGIKQKK